MNYHSDSSENDLDFLLDDPLQDINRESLRISKNIPKKIRADDLTLILPPPLPPLPSPISPKESSWTNDQ